MIAAARKAVPQADFAPGDLSGWMPEDRPCLLFSNAAFHWVPDHLAVLERLLGTLAPGGVLAVQMPDNLGEPSHRLMVEAAADGPWAAKLGQAAAARDVLPAPRRYHERLKPRCARLDIWHTIYNHPLQGVAGIVGWLSSTGLRPFLAPLEGAERAGYLAAYETRLAAAYPALADGTVLLRFPRLFIVAVR